MRHFLALLLVEVNQFAFRHYWRGEAAADRDFPEWFQFLGQSCDGRAVGRRITVASWPAPLRPIAGMKVRDGNQKQHQEQWPIGNCQSQISAQLPMPLPTCQWMMSVSHFEMVILTVSPFSVDQKPGDILCQIIRH